MTKLTYYWDAYCGWCYGFQGELEKFLAANPELEIDLVAGVLFAEDRLVKEMASYCFPINERIEQVFGLPFGESYKQMMQTSSQAMNSLYPAAALTWVKQYLRNRQLYAFSRQLMNCFFVEGKDLAQFDSYLSLLAEFGLSEKQEELKAVLANPLDFALVQVQARNQAGVTAYPTLLLAYQEKIYNLRPNGVYLSADLIQAYQDITKAK